jgi:glutathione S-transferase
MAKPITVVYWPMLARGASLVRMLEHTGTPYDYVSDKAVMAQHLSSNMFNSARENGEPQGDNFAPPLLIDGDVQISQSVATCLYLGHKLGLTPPGYNDFKAMQFCADIVDCFEGNLGKNNEDGAALKSFLAGDRWKALMGNIERSIKGPYYFGEKPSAVDFFLLQHMDWRTANVFEPLKTKGLDVMAAYPKVRGAHEALMATDAYTNYAGGLRQMGSIKDEVLAAF